MTEAMSAIVTALIMAIASVICQVLINASNRKKRVAEDAEKEKEKAVIDARKEENLQNRLNGIEEKLDEHNGYAKLLSTIQTDIAVIKNDIKTLYKAKG
jgi:hypothetical protein